MSEVEHHRMREQIAALDFEPIKFRLRNGSELENHCLEWVEEEYRRFLFLCGKYRAEIIVPSTPVDVFWHHHILDTRKYERDTCNALGFFLHHFPYFGLRSESDFCDRNEAYRVTFSLYEREFGAALATVSTFAQFPGSVCDGGDDGRRVSEDYQLVQDAALSGAPLH